MPRVSDPRPTDAQTCATSCRKVGSNMTSAKESAVLRPFRGSAIGSAVVLLVSFVTLWFGFWQATNQLSVITFLRDGGAPQIRVAPTADTSPSDILPGT